MLLREFGIIVIRLMLICWILVVVVSMHFPTPDQFADHSTSQEQVREGWRILKKIANRLGQVIVLPEWLDGDKLLHFLAYFGIAALWGLLLWFQQKWNAKVACWLLLLLAGFAGLDEGLQMFWGRIGELSDWVANLLGAGVGVGGGWLLFGSRK